MNNSKNKVKTSWLHISDLHVFPETDTEFMLDDYGELAQIISPQFLIVTGDFRYLKESHKTDFSLAKNYLESLIEVFCIDKKDVFLVPGNHDVNDYDLRNRTIVDICAHSNEGDYNFHSKYPLHKGFFEYKNFVTDFF